MQYTEKKKCSFWKEMFILCMALEAFILKVMTKNIKNKVRKTNEKIKASVCTAAKECQLRAPTLLTVNTGKNCAGCYRQRNKSQVLQSWDSFKTYQFSAKVIQKNPDKTSHPSPFLCIINLQWGIYKGKGGTRKKQSFCQDVKWNRADQIQGQSFSPTNPTFKRLL